MGFFKFLGREKTKDLNELDLPPAPPPIEGFEDDNVGDFPDIRAPSNESFSPDDNLDMNLKEDDSLDMEMKDTNKDLHSDKIDDILDFPEIPHEDSTLSAPEIEHEDMPSAEINNYNPNDNSFMQATRSVPEQEPLQKIVEKPKIATRHYGTDKIIRSGKAIYVRVDKLKDGKGILVLRNKNGKYEIIKSFGNRVAFFKRKQMFRGQMDVVALRIQMRVLRPLFVTARPAVIIVPKKLQGLILSEKALKCLCQSVFTAGRIARDAD